MVTTIEREAFYEIRPCDIGQDTIMAFDNQWSVVDWIGSIQAQDVGKRVFERGGAILQVENNEQRDARVSAWMATLPVKVLDLAGALAQARGNAEAIPVEDTGGTCNFDTGKVRLSGWRETHVQAAAKIASVTANKWPRGWWHFDGWPDAQGMNQTIKAEAFARTMKDRGYEASVHYAMD